MMKRFSSMEEQVAGRCKAFTGFGIFEDGKQCKNGIVYRDLVGGAKLGWVKRAPCLMRNETDICCSEREFPTQQEVTDEVARMDVDRKCLMDAIKLCATDSEKKGFERGGKGVAGDVKCPVCGKRLRYSRAGSNGHIWGKCQTEGCLSWMQ